VKAAGRRDPDQRPQEFRIARDDRGRKPAVAYQARRPVGIGQHRLEQLGALHQPGLQRLPFRSVDQQRNVTERPGAIGARCILVHAIEHAGIVQVTVGGGEAPIDLLRPQRRKQAEQRLPVRAYAAVAIDHLVEDAGQRTIAREQRLEIVLRDILAFRRAVALGCHPSLIHTGHQT
jgi:hypothetical protein